MTTCSEGELGPDCWSSSCSISTDSTDGPPNPRALPPGPFTITLRHAAVRYQPDGSPALDRVSLDLRPGDGSPSSAPTGRQVHRRRGLLRFCELSSGTAILNGHDLASYAADDIRSASAEARKTPTCSTPPSATTCGSPAPPLPTSRSRPPPPAPGCCPGSDRSPTAGTPQSAPTGKPFRRRTATPRAGPRVSCRPGAADPRRTHRPPGPSPRADRRPAASHRRPHRPVHHPPARRARPDRTRSWCLTTARSPNNAPTSSSATRTGPISGCGTATMSSSASAVTRNVRRVG